MKTIPFTHNNSAYEIRVLNDGDTISVRVFSGDHPANGFCYQITVPTAVDLHRIVGGHAVDHLVAIAKEDVIENRWADFAEPQIDQR